MSRLKRWLISYGRAYAWGRRVNAYVRYLLRRPHEADFAAFRRFNSRTGLFLDVGANFGQSALSFRIFNRRSPILSIEPLAYHERHLRLLKRFLRGFDYLICAAGEASGSATLHVPTHRGVPLTGEASLLREAAEESFWLRHQIGDAATAEPIEVVEVPVEVRRLDDLGLAPDFVKIDVEEFELSVLRGFAKTLETHRPLLLIERSRSATGVREFLEPLGYEPYVYVADGDRLERYVGQPAMNLFYVPAGDWLSS
jgi:FkbM family methyltransferase